jgi:hypothetical protein
MSTPQASDVVQALAARLHEAGVAVYTPDAPYPKTPPVPAVVFGRLPQSPLLAVAINRYGTDADILNLENPTVRVQLRWRAATTSPLDVDTIADAAYRVLQFTETSGPQTWPGNVRVQSCTRRIAAPSEPNANGQWERCDSFELIINPT